MGKDRYARIGEIKHRPQRMEQSMETIHGKMARNYETDDVVRIEGVGLDQNSGVPVIIFSTEMGQRMAQAVETFFVQFEIVEQSAQVIFTFDPEDTEFWEACERLAEEFNVTMEAEGVEDETVSGAVVH